MLLGYGSREMISPLYLLLLVFSRFFREATTALLIRSVLLLKVAVLNNACADTQFANQVEDIHIQRDFQLGRIKSPQMRRRKIMKDFISTYVCICACLCIPIWTCTRRHSTSANMLCVYPCLCVQVWYMCILFMYTDASCVFISENTKSSYVRFELLEDGRETSCHTWKTRLFKVKVI